MDTIIKKLKRMVTKEMVIKLLIITIVVMFQYYATDSQKHFVNIFFLLVAFFASLYLHEKFFPFFTISIGLFIMASVQELYDITYTHLPVTKNIHLFARLMFGVAIIEPLISKFFNNEKL